MSFKSLARVCAALLLLPLAAHARADDKVSKERIESGGRRRTYYLFAPSSLKPGAPLVVLFHGSDRNGLSLVERWKALAAREGFVIAGPDSRDSKGWRTPDDGPEFIHDLVEALKAKYPLDARRVYLFGHSAGAVFALHLAMKESEYFAAAAVHAGAWREEGEFKSLEQAKRKTPVAIFVGDRDQFFPLGAVRATEAALKGRGHQVEVTVMKGHDHWYYDRAPDINAAAWDFLKTRSLDADPKYRPEVTDTTARDLNAALAEINALRAKASEALRRFDAGDEELRAKRAAGDAQGAAVLLRAQLETASGIASAFRDAAAAAERAGASKLPDNLRQFLTLLARADARRAEGYDVLKGRVELQLAGETQAKVNEAVRRFEKLLDEADELERQANLARSAQGP
ncbi:MAG TPA: alpha/beta hydrolase-fold protein [Pyrinomonadaceae bacterium]|nr:alpha/beta hydrolase-fold protein [Pyrinomonadaceae bacterium]